MLGFTAFEAGVAFFPMTVVNFAVAMTIPRLTTRFGQAVPLATGVTLTLIGMAWLMVNTFHQVGMALGLGVLIAASAHAGHGLTAPAAVLTAHVNTALTAGSVLLALCLIATFALILPTELAGRRRDARRSDLPAPPERVLATATRD